MPSIIGIDSRMFIRKMLKKDATEGKFQAVLGVAVKVKDFQKFKLAYEQALKTAFASTDTLPEYQHYCVNDLLHNGRGTKILDEFSKNIAPHVERVHVFYTLFSKTRLAEVKVYGRKARKEHLKLSAPTRSYEELIYEHTLHAFPVICAWRLSPYMKKGTIEFHLDSFGGMICEAYEELIASEHKISAYPGGDCVNPVISTADLLLAVIDNRLRLQRPPMNRLIFENIRPALPEFGDRTLVYPISNKHLPKITPVDDVSLDPTKHIRHPVFWLFKGEDIIESGTLKRSSAFRNLQDFAAAKNAVVKLFEKQKDITQFTPGDYGVFLNKRGEDIIDSYALLGKKFTKFDLEVMAPKNHKQEKTVL